MGKKKWLKDNILNIVQIMPIIGGVVVTVVAWLQGIAWYLIVAFGVILGMLVIPTTLLTINQLATWKERHKKKLTQLSDKEIEDTIRNWLVNDPGYKFQMKDVNDSVFHNDRLFHFEVEDDWGRVISIARPRAKPTRLDLASAVTLGTEHKKKYEALGPKFKRDILHNLRAEMARFGVMFRGMDTTLERIDISDSVSLDDTLTEFYLKQRILFMIRATFLLNELIAQELED